MAKYTQEQIAIACELREMGLTYRGIAKKIGMHAASVYEYCQIHGALSPNDTKVHAAPTFTSELDAMILELRMLGMKTPQIGRRVNRAEKSVRNRLRALAFNEAKMEALAEVE